MSSLEEHQSALVLYEITDPPKYSLLRYINCSAGWVNLTPPGVFHEKGDHLYFERNGDFIRVAALDEDDVVIIFRDGKKGEKQ